MVTYVIYMENPDNQKFEELKDIANNITLIELEQAYRERYKRFKCRCGEKLTTFLKKYQDRDDLTIYYDDDNMTINQDASGGGGCRIIKENLRKIFYNVLKRKVPENIKIKLDVC